MSCASTAGRSAAIMRDVPAARPTPGRRRRRTMSPDDASADDDDGERPAEAPGERPSPVTSHDRRRAGRRANGPPRPPITHRAQPRKPRHHRLVLALLAGTVASSRPSAGARPRPAGRRRDRAAGAARRGPGGHAGDHGPGRRDAPRARRTPLGVAEPQIQKDGTDQISVAVPARSIPRPRRDRSARPARSTSSRSRTASRPASRARSSRRGGIAPKNSLYELLKAAQASGRGRLHVLLRVRARQARPAAERQAAKTQEQLLQPLRREAARRLEVLGVPKGKLAVSCQPTAEPGCPVVAPATATGRTGKTYWYMFDLPPQDAAPDGQGPDRRRRPTSTRRAASRS